MYVLWDWDCLLCPGVCMGDGLIPGIGFIWFRVWKGFSDTVCALCSGTVSTLMSAVKRRRIRLYSKLQCSCLVWISNSHYMLVEMI